MNLPVGRAAYVVTTDQQENLVVYPVNEGLGLAVYDPDAKVGGVLHFTRPDSSESPDKAKSLPAMFADTGIAAFLWEVFKHGATKKNLQVKLAGGAELFRGAPGIGQKNVLTAKRILWKNSLVVAAECVGGALGLRLSLNMATGKVMVKTSNEEKAL